MAFWGFSRDAQLSVVTVFASSVLRRVLQSLIGCPFSIRFSLASSSFPFVLGRVVKFWRPSWQLLGFSLPGPGSWGFVFLVGVLFHLLAVGFL